ncbi:MAG: Na/Pi cotransporter family protein [Clostridia bacterium]|nr:Na/Pi cotransporter family protein [Clostridia bacterium]
MNIFSIFTLLGGLAFFLYGMTVMSNGLETISGGGLERIMKKVTANDFLGFFLGAGITVAIQSSSAFTVMLVGLVNSGLLNFANTFGLIMGSNVGTTLTAWLLSLAGLEGKWYIEILNPSNFAPLLAFIGIAMQMFSKSEKKHNLGNIFVGFTVLIIGMDLMSDSMLSFRTLPGFDSFLATLKSPIVALLISTVFTGVIQSSAATIGIVQALALSGGITWEMAIPLVLGANIGTCVTALIGSIGTNKAAKRVVIMHFSVNVFGSVFCMILMYILRAFGVGVLAAPIAMVGVAIIHTLFNAINTVLLIPIKKLIVKFCEVVVPDREEEEHTLVLDERLLTVPAVAVGTAFDHTVEMSALAIESIEKSLPLIDKYDEAAAEEIKELENRIDKYEDKLGTFMVKLSKEEISDVDTNQVTKMLHTINDFERIGDHACNMVKVAKEMRDKNIAFSKEATKELSVLTDALNEILALTKEAFAKTDVEIAFKIEPLEQVVDKLIYDIKANHITRLQSGNCTIELGFVLHDLLTNYERVSDHCSNVAVAIIETAHGSFQTHEYLRDVKRTNEEFKKDYEEYLEKFAL